VQGNTGRKPFWDLGFVPQKMDTLMFHSSSGDLLNMDLF
jgi:hypothetical protein